MRRVNSDILLGRLKKSPPLPTENAISLIKKQLHQQEDDIDMMQLRVSLICPVKFFIVCFFFLMEKGSVGDQRGKREGG